jgi:hypothetical protein
MSQPLHDRVPDKRERLRRRRAAAVYLHEKWGFGSYKSLAKLAVTGGGPEFRRAGRIPLYPEDALDDWARGRLSPRVRSTSELRVDLSDIKPTVGDHPGAPPSLNVTSTAPPPRRRGRPRKTSASTPLEAA